MIPSTSPAQAGQQAQRPIDAIAAKLERQADVLRILEEETQNVIARARAELQQTREAVEKANAQRASIRDLISRADDIGKQYLDQVGIVQQAMGVTAACKTALTDAKDRLERVRNEVILQETPIERGAPGKINGGNKETRDVQAAQALAEDNNYQTAKHELEACQIDADQAEIEERAAMLKLSALKAITKLYTSELAVVADLGLE